MQAIIYVSGADRSFSADAPDLTGKAVVDVEIPNGLTLSFAVMQLQALVMQFESAANQQIDYSQVVFKITIGNAA